MNYGHQFFDDTPSEFSHLLYILQRLGRKTDRRICISQDVLCLKKFCVKNRRQKIEAKIIESHISKWFIILYELINLLLRYN